MKSSKVVPEVLRRGVVVAALSAAMPGAAADIQAAHENPVEAQLIAEHVALVPGQTEQLGLLLRHQPHWHTYWINPGDSGLPTTLAWTLPLGYKAADIDWPLPRRFEVGGLYNFGYDGGVVLPVTLSVPADAQVGSIARVAVAAKWLVCREECIPGKGSFTLDLPVVRESAKPDARWTQQFSDARLAQPQATAWTGTARDDNGRIVIRLGGAGLPPTSAPLDAFVAERKILDNKPPTIRAEGDALVIESGRSEYFSTAPEQIDLVVTQQGATDSKGWHVRVPFSRAAADPSK